MSTTPMLEVQPAPSHLGFIPEDTEDTDWPKGISVVIPTLDEAGSVEELVRRLDAVLTPGPYQLIFIDDHSTDQTVERLQTIAQRYPLEVYPKAGMKGKAFSLMEGFAKAKYDIVAMIDGDLQYPPESLRTMAGMVRKGEADVVVANRRERHVRWSRKLMSNVNRQVFGRLLWKLDVDVQAGLKVFRREIIERLDMRPGSGWTFDLGFLAGARSAGYSIAGYDIEFAERTKGQSKVSWLAASKEIAVSAIRLRLRPPHHVPFSQQQEQRYGKGFHFKGERYVTHTALSRHDLAVLRTYPGQRVVIAGILTAVAAGLAIDWHTTLLVLVSSLTFLYFCDLLFNLYLIVKSFHKNAEIRIPTRQIRERADWPRYTVFCPLYRESAVVPQFIAAMQGLDYPKDKLEVMLLLEEDDAETIGDIRAMELPDYFRILVVPHAMPKTKPKACNYGLMYATGEYAVIYDAEDIPDPLQLKQAVIAFSRVSRNVGCVQAKLNYYNWNQNVLTRLFTLEYSLWFNLVLTGLNSISAPIPLGGTSNHFRVQDLRNLEGWDPFNVTEDADLGMRIAKRGLRTVILNSFTMEEANSEFRNWMKQRSRWIKGYIQTYLVHMRSPRRFAEQNRSHLLFFQLVVGGKVLSMLINPLLWVTTIMYFAVPETREFIKSLYLAPIFYIGSVSLIFGNFLYMYYYMIGAIRQRRPELTAYALLVPFYWLMMSWASIFAFRDLLVRPFHWHKTKHGLHLKKREPAQRTEGQVPALETA